MQQWEFAALLRAVRLRRGIRQRDLAARVGVAQAQMSHYEQGEAFPDEARLRRWAAYLAVPVPSNLVMQRRIPHPCGTPAAARRHYKAGEKPDEACRRAINEYQRARRVGSS